MRIATCMEPLICIPVCTTESTVAASTRFYELGERLSRIGDKTDKLPHTSLNHSRDILRHEFGVTMSALSKRYGVGTKTFFSRSAVP